MKKIILASGSPRRKQILLLAHIDFEVIVRPIEEVYPDHYKAQEAAIHVAKNKAYAVKNFLKTREIIVAADTMVVLENIIIGKPANREDAIKTLCLLSGKTHEVITGVCIIDMENEFVFYETTHVEFKEITKDQIEFYVDTYKPFDKAGAYAIQEWIGVIGIKSITGDYYNVMGLPINRIFDILNMK